MPERLRGATNKVVGTKQTLRAIEGGKAKVVYIADDAEERVVAKVKELCACMGIETVHVPTMKELGEICGIEVGAASAALIDQ